METRAPTAPACVVVIDDDSAVRHSLKFVLEIVGYRVAVYPVALLDRAEGDLATASCLIIDHELTPISGLDILVYLRDRGRHTPAVLTAVRLAVRQMQLARERNVTIVRKPIIDDDLFLAVEKAIAPGPH